MKAERRLQLPQRPPTAPAPKPRRRPLRQRTAAMPLLQSRHPGAAPPDTSAAARSSSCRRPRRRRSGTDEGQQGPLSPVVRKMAREHNIDLRQVRGTGAGGRITKSDVEAYIAGRSASGAASAPPAQAVSGYAGSSAALRSLQPQLRPPMPAPPPMPRGEQAKTRIEPMSNMRQKIAEHMIFSKRTSAHVTTVHKVDMTKIAKIRDKQKERVPGAVWLRADVSCRLSRAPRRKRCARSRSSMRPSRARTSCTTTRSISGSLSRWMAARA